MPIVRPRVFNNRDLTLDVRLETCVNDINIDMTGRKSYNFGLFRDKSIGFGITDISIEVNPSLQPVIDITFKDLYGNTLFGTQRTDGESTPLDYSVLYNWPPPKFYFTFKGYLGSPVTWVLNLKKLSTGYDSSDSSYTLKASFVPNQWGIFADIPFLYLLAVKGLKKREINADSEKIETIFDYIKIGKSVDVKKVEFTKQFDTLKNQTSAVYSDVFNAINYSKVVSSEVLIDGNVNGDIIEGFVPFAVTRPDWLNSSNAASLTTRPEDKEILNAFLVKYCLYIEASPTLNGSGPKSMGTSIKSKDELNYVYSGSTTNEKIPEPTVESLSPPKATDASINKDVFKAFQESYKSNEQSIREGNRKKLSPLSKNLSLIDKAVQEKFIEKTSTELSKIVISEIFSKLAGDTGYLTGKILEAGIKGYANFSEIRKSSKEIVGRNFPLVFKKGEEDNGAGASEVPAIKENLDSGVDYGVDDNEMKFVEEFIAAVSEGISENKDFDSSAVDSGESKLKVRVNNLEILQQNPYYSDYKNIAGNILLRSGIIGYITRSNDPNKPGDYGNISQIDNDSNGQISELAKKDMDNISKENLLDLSESDLLKLKKFCNFFTRLFKPDGEINELAGPNNIPQSTEGLLQAKPGEVLNDSLLNFNVEVTNNGIVSTTININEFMRSDSSASAVSARNILSTSNQQMVNSTHFLNYGISTRFYHNNLPWILPKQSSDDKYIMLLFEGEDAKNATTVDSSKTDQEFSSQSEESKDNPNGFFSWVKAQEEPLGVIPINSFNTEVDGKKEKAGRVKILQDYINVAGFLQNIGLKSLGASLFILNPFIGIFTFISKNRVGGVLSYNKIKQNPQESVEIDLDASNNNEVVYKVDDNSFYVNYEPEYDVIDNTRKVVAINKIDNFELVEDNQTQTINQLPAKDLAYTIYSHTFDDADYAEIVWGLFLSENGENSGPGRSHRVAIRSMCEDLLKKITEFEDKKSQETGKVLSKANEQKNEIYKQFHNIFSQWNLLAYNDSSSYKLEGGNNLCGIGTGEDSELPSRLEKVYGGSHSNFKKGDQYENGSFRYDYPFNGMNGETDPVDVKKAIINIDALYKPDAKTTVLNIIQQICQKNNFMFIPIPGNGNYDNITEIYEPQPVASEISVSNYFHVLFMPSPDSRVYDNDSKTTKGTGQGSKRTDFAVQAIGVRFGSIDNQVFKNLSVNLDDNKPTAESIVNLQKLVSSENKNKVVTKDCSMLPVLQGRSYTASLDMLGNAQIFPLQFFYIEGSPLFEGLYQVMKVKHSIIPNDMTTTMEGMRLAFSSEGGYGGIKPIVLKDSKGILKSSNVAAGILAGPTRSNITVSSSNQNSVGPPLSSTADGYISKYVTLQAATFSPRNQKLGNNNTPNESELQNMKYVAQNIYDKLVEKFGASNIRINSFFRNDVLNNAVGGSPTSWHRVGSAIDIGTLSTKYSNDDIYYYILRNLPFTELIWEYGDDNEPKWVHVALNSDAGARGKSGVKRIPKNPLKL